MDNNLFNERTIKECIKEEVNQKQKNASKEWLDLLSKGELKKEFKSELNSILLPINSRLGISPLKQEKS